MAKGWEGRIQEIRNYNTKKRKQLTDYNKQNKKDNIDSTDWPTYIYIIKIKPNYEAIKLVRWATKPGKDLIEIIGIHNVNRDYARLLHTALSKQEKKRSEDPPDDEGSDSSKSSNWDFYEDLGY